MIKKHSLTIFAIVSGLVIGSELVTTKPTFMTFAAILFCCLWIGILCKELLK